MSLSITNETKNNLAITNVAKDSSQTWNDADYTWNEATGTWDEAGVVLAQPAKNNLAITNINKN